MEPVLLYLLQNFPNMVEGLGLRVSVSLVLTYC